jgi:tetratricopeptide (TPR) repeat protein
LPIFLLSFFVLFSFSNGNYSYCYAEFISINSKSSTPNSELAKRYLKLGNSYRESGNFELALHYLALGQQPFFKQRNFDESYWYAVSLEYMAYCFRDMGNNLEARYHLEQSLAIYQKIIGMRQGSQSAMREVIQKLENELRSAQYQTSNSEAQIETPVLNLDNRRLTKFPDDITRKKIDNISIANNRFTNFPDEILNFPTVKILDVSFNRIRNFPDLSKLQSLE